VRRFTLSYRTSNGDVLRLFNLSSSAADEIISAQTALGSSDFVRYAQTREYADVECVFLRRHPLPEMGHLS